MCRLFNGHQVTDPTAISLSESQHTCAEFRGWEVPSTHKEEFDDLVGCGLRVTLTDGTYGDVDGVRKQQIPQA